MFQYQSSLKAKQKKSYGDGDDDCSETCFLLFDCSEHNLLI